MIRMEDDCCGCATENYPCLGSACVNRNVPHFYCDKCGCEEDAENLFAYEGEKADLDLCDDCFTEFIKMKTPRLADLIKEGKVKI